MARALRIDCAHLGRQSADLHRQQLVPPHFGPPRVHPKPIPPKPPAWRDGPAIRGMLGEVSLLRAVSEDQFPLSPARWTYDMGALQRPKIPTQ